MNNVEVLKSNLYEIYNDSVKGKDFEKIIESLDSIKVNSLVNYYIYHVNNYNKDDQEIIEIIIKILQNVYNNSGLLSPVPDDEYDKLYEILLSFTDDIVGGDNVKDKVVSYHKYPDLRGTLDKVHFITDEEKGKDKRKSIEYWKRSCESVLGESFNEVNDIVYIFPKFDGLSVIFECDKKGNVVKALTRGDTVRNEAIDITPLFSMIKFKPINDWDSDFGIKTEVVMQLDDFEKFCKKVEPYKNPRSAVSSIINSKEPDVRMLKYLTIVPLRVQNFDTKEIRIHPDAFELYPVYAEHLNKYKSFKPLFDVLKNCMENDMRIPIDGVVLSLYDEHIKTVLGRKDAINKYEIAYKFQPVGVKTILKEVEFTTGILGRITPVAKIEPIKMNGNTICNISLGSIDRFMSLRLHEGDEVIVKYDIIPYLYIDDTCKRSGSELIKIPTHCEYCGEKLVNDPLLTCVNMNCQCRVIGKIVNYIEKMDIPNISIGIVTTLFNNGFLKSIEDLYRLEDHQKEIENLDGFGKKSFKNIIKGINSRREVNDYVVLGSLGIPSIGRKIFTRISNIYYIYDILEICLNDEIDKLTVIPGIKTKTANAIIAGIKMNADLIKFLEKELKIKHDNSKGKFKVLFTKVRDKDFEKFLKENDIDVCDSYNKEIDMVIRPDDKSKSTKVDKAIKDGKKLMSIDDAYKYFKYNRKG